MFVTRMYIRAYLILVKFGVFEIIFFLYLNYYFFVNIKMQIHRNKYLKSFLDTLVKINTEKHCTYYKKFNFSLMRLKILSPFSESQLIKP